VLEKVNKETEIKMSNVGPIAVFKQHSYNKIACFYIDGVTIGWCDRSAVALTGRVENCIV